MLDSTAGDFATNGNDGYQLVLNVTLVMQFGQTETDAINDPIWDHDNSLVSRIPIIPDNRIWYETH
jgi:formylmethanofuran dehydrogenase subunit E-like metal-binding protein